MAANKAQRVLPSSPPSWSEECDRLLKTLGDDAAALETAEHALAAVAAGTVDAAALDPSVAALARHCEAASADEQSSRFGQAVSRLSYLHTNAEQKQAHRVASQTADEIREMVARVTLESVSPNSDAESDDDAIVALSGTVDEGMESEDDSVQMLPAAADDSEEAGRRLALRQEAEKRAAARARRRSEEADAALARRLAGADADQIESDAALARQLAQEDAPVDVIDVDAPVPTPIGPERAPTPAKPPASVALVTPPTAPPAVRHARIVIPGGAVLEMRGMPAGQPLGRFWEPLREQLGLAPDDDPMATYRLVRLRRGRPGGALEPHLGEKRYNREDLRNLTVGGECSAERRTQFRVEPFDVLGDPQVLRGGSFFGNAEVLRLTAPDGGLASPIVLLRDPKRDQGLFIANLLKKYATIQPLPKRVHADAIRAMCAKPTNAAEWVRNAGKEKRRRNKEALAAAFSQGRPNRDSEPPKDVPTYLKQLADDAQVGSGGQIAQHTIKIEDLPAAVSACFIPQVSRNVPDDFCKVMDEHLDMAAAAVADTSLVPRDGPDDDPAARELAARALHNRRPPYVAHGIMYGPRGQLVPHVDAIGHWVVLFNLGNDCTFHCGTPTHLRKSMKYGGLVSFGGYRDGFEFKSGDCLVFNGAHTHQAMHGLSRITMGTNPLRSEAWLEKTRVSLQIRQL
jgi:hypothetical protein